MLARSLSYYRRTNAAVVLGVATSVAVLAGALLVGDSVRGSLSDLSRGRLGRADHAITSSRFFREALAENLAARPRFPGSFAAAAPLIVLHGVVTHAENGRRASGVAVYGVDDRFWRFHGCAASGPEGREALVSGALASELGGGPGSTLLVALDAPSDVPGASLFGRRDTLARTIGLSLRRVQPAEELGDFSLQADQQAVRAVFVPLRLLQRALDRESRVNTILLAEARSGEDAGRRAVEAARLLHEAIDLEDLGLRLRLLPGQRGLSLESATALLDDALAEAARTAASRLGLRASSFLTYLASSIRAGDRSIPYSLVTAADEGSWKALSGGRPAAPGRAPILVNEWAARDLGVRRGDRVTLDYYVWEEEGRLETRSASFEVESIVPLTSLAGDRDLTPDYPGITESVSLSQWDPPFPIDLRLVRPKDEEYWERHRTTPKAFLPLARGQALWGHRLGRLTSIRFRPADGSDAAAARSAFAEALRASLDPLQAGFAVTPARAQGLAASRGATDFGEYFAYFSVFLVAAALLLAGLFFRLGVEQRLREVGLLRAVGFTAARVRSGLLAEGTVLALLGSLLGALAAPAYAGLLIVGLRTLWVDAVGTRDLSLHVTAASLILGVLGGVLIGPVVVAATLRGLERATPRRLLTGTREDIAGRPVEERRASWLGAIAVGAAAALLAGAGLGRVPPVAGFFGAGTLLLVAALASEWRWLSARRRGVPGRSVARLGFRNASYRPGRSLLSIALIASATFVIVSVGAFRRDAAADADDRSSGTGGFALLAESLLPLHHDPGTPDGREALGLTEAGSTLEGVRFARFRLRPGEDASCLNLYRPRSPRILAPAPAFLEEGRFRFQESLAATPEERANPWRLLEKETLDGAIPVIADGNSMSYVLHRKLGEELALERPGATPLRLRFVGALHDSVLQSELLMSEKRFLAAFPEIEGYRVFLIEVPGARRDVVAGVLESRLADAGLDVVATGERLAGFHRVENTYLSTFQALGGLGLLLGTVGLATVLVRNALERRRELALLQAVGYHGGHLTTMVLAENVWLLLVGLGTGTGSALLAIAPTVAERGGRFPAVALAALLLAVFSTGIAVSRLAVAVIRRAPLLAALRAE